MNTDIYSMWYKQPSVLTKTPNISIMIRLEGIESYGLYMQFADMLHTIGGYQEYDFKKICLILGYTKKNIKEKLNRVLNNYNLFDFCVDEFGVEFVGLERIKKDIESLRKHKINGAKGGLKRAENYLKRKENNLCLGNLDKFDLVGVFKTYLIKNKRNGYYKIGKSKDPLKREKTLQSEEPMIGIIKVFDKDIESVLHKDYKSFRVRGEWFELSKIQIKFICNNY